MDNLLTHLILWVSIFLSVLQFLVIFDVILSWLMLAWLKWRPKFLSDIIDPVYKSIRSAIPTSFWPLDFTPIIIIIGLWLLNNILFLFFPEVALIIENIR